MPEATAEGRRKKRDIRSDHRVIVLATAILLVGIGTGLGRHTSDGGNSSRIAGTCPVYEEGVDQTRARDALNQAVGTRTPCLWYNHSHCEGFFCIRSTS